MSNVGKKLPITPYLTADEVRQIIRKSKTTLRRWRAIGYGPKFVRLQREVRYASSDVEDWLDALSGRPNGEDPS
jgi:predicted DNA-binding transcriptional regulator AlpA